MTDTAWTALMAALTIFFAFGTLWAFRARGIPAGLRGLALTLLPAAAWLTGTLEMFTEVGTSILDWASGLVFSPQVWTGVGLAGTSLLFWLIAGRMRSSAVAKARGAKTQVPGPTGSATSGALPANTPTKQGPVVGGASDPDLADVEEILKRRGIS